MTRNRKITLAALGLLGAGGLAALAIPAIAQERGRMGADRLFQAADADRDGRVTSGEAWTALSARFAEADADRDGGVTWDEFRAHAMAAMGGRTPPAGRLARMEERGQGMFRALDADRDGKVTLTELRPFAEAMFRTRDANGDDALTREEVGPPPPRGDRPARGG